MLIAFLNEARKSKLINIVTLLREYSGGVDWKSDLLNSYN
jgi:hypothetical protein